MKKALEALIAVCVLTSVAQAQFCHTERPTEGVRAALLFTSTEAADVVAELAANDALTGNDSSVSIVRTPGHSWVRSAFNGLSPDGTLRPAAIAGPRPSELPGSPVNGVDIRSTSTPMFTPPNLTETNGTLEQFGESRTGMRLQGMLDALETDVRSMPEQQESNAGPPTATENELVPEPTTYGLFGVMALLGIAVARKLHGT